MNFLLQKIFVALYLRVIIISQYFVLCNSAIHIVIGINVLLTFSFVLIRSHSPGRCAVYGFSQLPLPSAPLASRSSCQPILLMEIYQNTPFKYTEKCTYYFYVLYVVNSQLPQTHTRIRKYKTHTHTHKHTHNTIFIWCGVVWYDMA